MNFYKLVKISILLFILANSKFAFAQEQEEIDLPTDELAKESVLPKFDRSVSVKNKNVILEKRFEMGAFVGFNFAEAIFNQMKYGINLGYHVNDSHNISLQFDMFASGNSQYGDQLRSRYGLLFDRAPRPSYSLWGNWEITAHYGKVSITKLTSANLNYYPIVGLGFVQYTHKMYYGINAGIGLKMYFSKNLALRADLKAQIMQQPLPFLTGKMTGAQPVPSMSEFGEKLVVGTIFDVGLVYLF